MVDIKSQAVETDKINNSIKNSDSKKIGLSERTVLNSVNPTLKINGVDFPVWMECTWRRVPCAKNVCPICSRFNRKRQKNLGHNEDSYGAEPILEDVFYNLKEALKVIKEDAELKGMGLCDPKDINNIKEPPRPERFKLYRQVVDWYESVSDTIEDSLMSGQEWVDLDSGLDLAWYSNLLPAKVYRQLCNRWFIRNDYEYGDFDYEYTRHVIKECLEIIKRAIFGNISLGEGFPISAEKLDPDKYTEKRLLNIYSGINNLEKKINKI